MTTPASRLLLFLVVALCFMICNIVSGDDLKLYTIHVKDDMAAGACVTRVSCTGYWNKMWPGQEFHYSDLRKYHVVCTAMWSDKDSNWIAFDPSRDSGHEDLFTSIREDGLYFSYDQSNWKQISKWYP